MPGHYVDIPVEREGAQVVTDRLRQVYILRPGDTCPPLHIVAEKGSRTDVTLVVMPGVDVDIRVDVDLMGEGADLRMAGLYVCGGKERVSVHTRVCHRAPGCSSDQVFTGIAGGGARVAFHGTIVVAPDAQQTQAFQQSRNLLLSQDARVETEPQLEIYADDVKCSHGATVGSLNADEQFYMRSRGVPEAEAKVLQMLSFLSPVLAGLEEKEALAAELEQAIRSIV